MVRLEPNPIGSTIIHINAGEELASHYSDLIKHPIQLHVLSSTITMTNLLGKEVRIRDNQKKTVLYLGILSTLCIVCCLWVHQASNCFPIRCRLRLQ